MLILSLIKLTHFNISSNHNITIYFFRINRPYSKQIDVRQDFVARQMTVGEVVVDEDESFCKILAVPDKDTALIQLPQVPGWNVHI